MVDINIKGVLYGIAAALPVFLKQNSGQFINMSSIAGVKVFAPGGTVYSGTKFAVRAISDGLRLEVGPKIRVCSIEPGSVDSELKYNTTGTAQKMVLDLYEKTALPAETIARAMAYAIEQWPTLTLTRSSSARPHRNSSSPIARRPRMIW